MADDLVVKVGADVRGFRTGMASLSGIAKGVGIAIGAAFAATGAVIIKSAQIGGDFKQALTETATVAQAYGKDLEALENKARQLGRETAFSATEAAEGMYALASAGFKTKEIIDATEHSMKLAGATNSSLAQSTSLVAATLMQFGLNADQTRRVTDTFAGAITNSQLTLERLSSAMVYAGTTGAGFGWSVEETTAAVAQFVNIGLKGEMAGTNLRTAMSQLAKGGDNLLTVLEELGLTYDDVDPKARNFGEIIKALGEKGMTSSQGIRAFGMEAGANMARLSKLAAEGKTDFEGFVKMLEKSQEGVGRTAEMYDRMMNTFKGKWISLKGSLEEVMIAIFTTFEDLGTGALDSIIAMTNRFSAAIVANKEQISGLFEALKDTAATTFRVIGELLGNFGLSGSSILTNLTNLVIGFNKHIEDPTTRQAIKDLGVLLSDIGKAIAIMVDRMKTGLGVLVVLIKALLASYVALREGIILVGSVIKTVFGGLYNYIANRYDEMIRVSKAAMEIMKSGWGDLSNYIVERMNYTRKSNDTMLTYFSQAWKFACDSIPKFFNEMVSKIESFHGTLKSYLISGINFVKVIWTNSFNFISDAFGRLLSEPLKVKIETIKNSFVIALNDIKTIFQNLFLTLKGYYDIFHVYLFTKARNLSDSFNSSLNNIKTSFQNLFLSLKGYYEVFHIWLKDKISGIVNFWIDSWNSVVEKFTGFIDKIRDKLNIFSSEEKKNQEDRVKKEKQSNDEIIKEKETMFDVFGRLLKRSSYEHGNQLRVQKAQLISYHGESDGLIKSHVSNSIGLYGQLKSAHEEALKEQLKSEKMLNEERIKLETASKHNFISSEGAKTETTKKEVKERVGAVKEAVKEEGELYDKLSKEILELSGKTRKAEELDIKKSHDEMRKLYKKNSDLIQKINMHEKLELSKIDEKYYKEAKDKALDFIKDRVKQQEELVEKRKSLEEELGLEVLRLTDRTYEAQRRVIEQEYNEQRRLAGNNADLIARIEQRKTLKIKQLAKEEAKDKLETLKKEIQARGEATEKAIELSKRQGSAFSQMIKGMKDKIGEIKREHYSWYDVGMDLMNAFVHNSTRLFGDVFYGFMTGRIRSLKDLWKEFCNAMIRSFANAIARMAAEWAASALFGGGGIGSIFGGGGIIGKVIGGVGKVVGKIGSFIGGLFAHGGYVQKNIPIIVGERGPEAFYGRAIGGSVNKGRPFRIGEFGPETFVPTSDGYIQPNDRNQQPEIHYHFENHGVLTEAEFFAKSLKDYQRLRMGYEIKTAPLHEKGLRLPT